MSGQNIEIVKLQVRRGPEAQLPILDQGEPAITTDTNKFFIGDGTNNHQLANLEDLANVNSQLAQITSQKILVESYPKQGGESDDTARIQRAIDAAPEFSTIEFKPNATYRVSGLTITKSLNINLNGAKFIFDHTATGVNGNPMFWFNGSVGTAYNLTTSTQNSTTVTMATTGQASNFAVGDYVLILDDKVVPRWDNNQNSNYGSSTGYANRYEVNMVKSISGDTITLNKPIEWGYDTNQRIQKITNPIMQPKIYGAANITEIDPGGQYSGNLFGNCPHIFHFEYCVEPKVYDCNFNQWNLHCVNFTFCVFPIVRDCTARDPYRPLIGGHGYFMRFAQCLGGLAANNTTRGVRHTVDYVMSYGGHSEHNYSFEPAVTAYSWHGMGSKRCSSAFDEVEGTVSDGWNIGNGSFSGDYDINIISPKYYAMSGTAIQVNCFTKGVRIHSPEIHAGTRAISILSGSEDVQVIGGKIDMIGNDASGTWGILARPKNALSDTVGYVPKNISFSGVKFTGNAATVLNTDGLLKIENCTFDVNITNGSATAVIFTDGTAGAGASPQDWVVRGNVIKGTYPRGIYIGLEPTRRYEVSDNFVDGGYSVLGFYLFASTKLRMFGNEDVSASNFTWSGDINVAKAGGAILFGNKPNANDNIMRNKITTVSTTVTSVDGATFDQFNLAQPSATTISNVTNGYEGKTVTFVGFNANTTLAASTNGSDTTVMYLKGDVNVNIPVRGTLTLRYTSGRWYEYSRSF